MHEEDMEDLDEEVGSTIELQGPTSSTGTPVEQYRPPTTVRNRIGRPIPICQECKRLKLKSNGRTPCNECIKQKHECKSNPGALTNVSGEPIPWSKLAFTDLFSWAHLSLPPAIVTFSRPPPQIPNPLGDKLHGAHAKFSPWGNTLPFVVGLATRVFQANSIVVSNHVLAQLRVWQRLLGWQPRPAHQGSIPAASIKPTAAASTVGTKGEGGWEDEGGRSSRAKPKGTDNHTVFVTAPPSEIEYYDIARPKDLSVLALAHEVFIMPAIAVQQRPGCGPTGVLSSPPPRTFSPLNLGSSSDSTSSSGPPLFPGRGVRVPYNFSTLNLDSSSDSTSSSQPPSSRFAVPRGSRPPVSGSPQHNVSPLITPQVVLQYLPRKAWRDAFLPEFDTLMVNHDGIGASGRRSFLKERIELMFKWADGSMQRMGSNGGESDPVAGSKSSSPPFSPFLTRDRGSGLIWGGGVRSGTLGKELPPPTVGLFAVASAVYALGALSYASKSIHGNISLDEDEGDNWGHSQCTAGPSVATTGAAPEIREPVMPVLNPHMHPLPDKATPSNLFNLARAALLAHDESALPPSLDYLHAHMLTWLYLLHPSDCASSVTSCRFEGASAGIGTGGMTVVEETIYKDLGKCVSIARRMGLDLVDRPSAKLRGGASGCGAVEDPEEENEEMGTWEKEMRRRVWWQLMMFDQQISENLGTLPLIPPGTYACKPPSTVDELVFGPMATAIPKPPENAICPNSTYFATKCQLLTIIKTLSYAQLEGGVTLDLARQLDAGVSSWRSALPTRYKIDFREKPEDSSFPDSDTIEVQACDLHIMANVFLLRLWLPFINEALSSCSQSSHDVLLTATTTANAVIVASHHLVTRFRSARPMSFGHYDFGNSLWFATGIMASVATMRSDVMCSSIARKGVEVAAALFHNQVVAGKRDSGYVPKFEVNKLMDHITRIVGEVPNERLSTGSKRKSDANLDQMKMCYGVPLPYLGTAAMTSATNINVPQKHSALRPQWNSELSDDMSRASAPPTRPRRQRKLDPGPPIDTERFHPMSEGSVGAAPTLANVVRESCASSMGSHSHTVMSQPTSFRSREIPPLGGIRRRQQRFNRHVSSIPSASEDDLTSDSGPPLSEAQQRRGSSPNITIGSCPPAQEPPPPG